MPRQHIRLFLKLLHQVDVQRISNNPYCIQYFNQITTHGAYYLSIYHHVLDTVIERCNRQPGDIRLIDYGCGNGVLGLFAKYCGFKNVVLADVDADFVHAARNLAQQMNLAVDVIPGSMDELQHHPADALVATDVIEHIYHLPSFFKKVEQLNPELVTVFTTASNPWNPRVVKKLKTLQWKDENVGNPGGGLSGNPHPAYRSIREDIIRPYLSSPSDVIAMVNATRGLKRDDILQAIETFKLHQTLPNPAPDNNTCHPETGSWTERIYTPQELEAAFAAGGFSCNFKSGFYNGFDGGVKSVLKKGLNLLISIFGKRIAPWILITGFKK
jgi:2-polyprenyl-3-methyl-5-hydroxy-6-metoxy-1,4-benzoquinol methylase